MKSSSKTIFYVIAIAAGVLAIGTAIAATAKGGGNKSNQSSNALFTIKTAPLSINLTQTGTIKSRDQHVVKSEVEGRTSVIYVIDEGVMVSKGDLLIELDASELENRLVDQQIQVENTEADFISSTENYEVVKIQTQSNIAKAELDNRFAQEDQTKYMEGEWPKTLMESETDLTLAKEDLKRATDKFEWSKKLSAEKYLSDTEFRADELALKRSQLQVDLATEKLSLLNEYTHPRRLTELDAEIKQKKLSLERVNRESASDLVQARARLRAREAELARQRDRLAKIEDQITKTKLYAPADGMVVYATSTEFSWRGDTEPLAEGQEVRERQELIHLPTADSMMVIVQIHESSLGKIKAGQRVQISIDALAGTMYTGTVTKIAPLPDAASVFMNPDLKIYDTQIMIEGVFPEIRTGMSCKATILIEHHDQAIAVPLQSIVGHAGQTVVYLMKNKEAKPHPVTTGLDNNAVIHIIDGLSDGDRVLLTPPLAGDVESSTSASEPTAQTTQDSKATSAPETNAPKKRRPSGNRP